MFEHLTRIQRYIYLALAMMLLVVVIVAVIELAYMLLVDLLEDSTFLRLETKGILVFFEYFILILIGIELLESIKSFIVDNTIHIEVILVLAIMAVARKVIVIDYSENDPVILVGTAALVIALCAGYFLVKWADSGKFFAKTQE